MLPEFFTLRYWARFCFYLNNQRSYGQMDATGGFSASNWSKNHPPRCSDCRLLMLYKVLKIQPTLGAICVPRFFVLACNTTTSDPMDKRRLQADSAHRMGLETTL